MKIRVHPVLLCFCLDLMFLFQLSVFQLHVWPLNPTTCAIISALSRPTMASPPTHHRHYHDHHHHHHHHHYIFKYRLGRLSKTTERIFSVKGVPPPHPLNRKSFCPKTDFLRKIFGNIPLRGGLGTPLSAKGFLAK